MLRGKANVLKYIQGNNAPYWTIFSQSGNRDNYIAKMEDIPDLSMDHACDKLSEALELLEEGKYVLKASRKYADAKGYFNIAFEHTGGSKAASKTVSQLPPGYVTTPDGKTTRLLTEDEVSARIQVQIDLLKKEMESKEKDKEIAELKKQLKESQANSANAAWGRILHRAEPLIGVLMEGYAKQKVAISGFPTEAHATKRVINQETNMAQDEANQKAVDHISALLQEWEDRYPGEPIAIIEKIVQTIRETPANYELYRTMLLK